VKSLNFPKKIQLKHLFAIILVCIVAFSSVGYILGSNGNGGTFTLSSGIYPGAPSYTIWVEDAVYYAKNAYGVIEYSGTNATAVIYNSLSSADGDGFVYVTGGVYSLSSTLIIDKNGSKLYGAGSGRIQEYFSDPPTPLERLTKGTVFKITTSDINAINITGNIYGVGLRSFAIDFSVSSTGNGIDCLASSGDRSVIEFDFYEIFVNDHDADSYALRMENPSEGVVTHFTSFGGCLLETVSKNTTQGTFNSGNIVFTQITGWVTKNITNHVVYFHRDGGTGWFNLCIFNRLFIIMKTTVSLGTYSSLRAEYMHHSQFNMLNIEMTYTSLADEVHLAECHDLDFISPYVLYSANAGWMAYTDCDHLRVFGGTVDIEVADRDRTDLWVGTFIHSVSANNEASLRDCLIWNGSMMLPTNAYGSAQGTSPLTVTHGMAYSPSWVSVTPNATAGDWYAGVVDGSDTFTITWTGGGTVWWWWTAGTYQIRP